MLKLRHAIGLGLHNILITASDALLFAADLVGDALQLDPPTVAVVFREVETPAKPTKPSKPGLN